MYLAVVLFLLFNDLLDTLKKQVEGKLVARLGELDYVTRKGNRVRMHGFVMLVTMEHVKYPESYRTRKWVCTHHFMENLIFLFPIQETDVLLLVGLQVPLSEVEQHVVRKEMLEMLQRCRKELTTLGYQL